MLLWNQPTAQTLLGETVATALSMLVLAFALFAPGTIVQLAANAPSVFMSRMASVQIIVPINRGNFNLFMVFLTMFSGSAAFQLCKAEPLSVEITKSYQTINKKRCFSV